MNRKVAFLLQRIASLALVIMVSTWCQAAPIQELIQKRLAMGEKPNRLINEKSPYLLQHAFNPVDWYPWGEEALARAMEENKPIFLSVGYSTCHWCHVMEEESFENPEIAAILNRWFIAVKVDREERPDVDQLYMSATQAMTGSGGWPMSVFLFPDGKPFYAGTYFPPRSQYGRPGFADVLAAIHEAWESRRSDLQDMAVRLVGELEKMSTPSATGGLEMDIMARTYRAFADDFDQVHGGFGQAPKFPRPVQFNFLLRYYHRTGEEKALDMVLETLRHMAGGGMWDHVGGGFHRYATDTRWRVPHFEKMLYDQAQLAETYLDAYQITHEEQYADTARLIFRYVQRDMTHPEGGFYSAEDADSIDPYNPDRKSEGAFYLWTEEEVNRILPEKDAHLFKYHFGIKPNGNAPEDPLGEFKGRNILYIAQSLAETAEKFDTSVAAVTASIETSLARLLEVRSGRQRPHLDDKILVAWNGLMIGAFARGAAILGDASLLESARNAALFLKNNLYDPADKTLVRRYREGEAGIEGQLDDYAFLVSGLLELYQTDQDPLWLQWAIDLTSKQITLFWDKDSGGFYTSGEDKSLPFRMKGDYDGAEPAGNSIAAMNLLQLGTITMNSEWSEMGKSCTEVFASVIAAQPKIMPQMIVAFDQADAKPQQVIISGKKGRDDTMAMLTAVFQTFYPGRIVLLADNSENEQLLAEYLPFVKDMGMTNQKATAYVCKDFTCQLPVNTLESLAEQLK